jgi:hypothetical protein
MKNLTKITTLEQIAAILLSRKISFTYYGEYYDRQILTITDRSCQVFLTATKYDISDIITFENADERLVPVEIVLDYLNRLNMRNSLTRTQIKEQGDRRDWVKYTVGFPRTFLVK